MSKRSNKDPPSLKNARSYDDWLKLMKIWQSFTDLDKKKQGPALLLSLEDDAQDTALTLTHDEIASDDGVQKIIQKLDGLFKKDETLKKFHALESFETYKRPPNTTIQQYLAEFERRLNKTKSYGTTWADDILAYKVLKSANLSENNEQLTKATITELNYSTMKIKLKNIFGETSALATADIDIKTEDINYTHNSYANLIDPQDENEPYNVHEQVCNPYEQENLHDTYYYNNKRPQRTFQNNRNQPFNRSNQQHQRYFNNRDISYSKPSQHPRGQIYSQNQQQQQQQQQRKVTYNTRPLPNRREGRNPPDRYGETTRCNTCESINHWSENCPDNIQNQKNPTLLATTDEVTLFEGDFDHPAHLKNLVSESWNSAILDSGASKTVCGKTWLQNFIGCLDQPQASQISYSPSKSVFKFGDGNKITSNCSVKLPATINNTPITILTDIVDCNIPLLFSRESMKKAGMQLDFKSDTANILGETVNLITTKSGHYALPLTIPRKLLNDAVIKNDYHNSSLTNIVQDTLTCNHENPSAQKMAIKLHQQFAHPPSSRLLKLLDSAGNPWNQDEVLKSEIKKLDDQCDICRVYKRPPPRPAVGLPMATTFQECVAMDLKFYKGHILLHLVDHATRLSASTVIPSKKPETIIKYILKIWISVYGSASKFLTDNGGEFCNQEFLNLCEAFNITVKTTSAESPWSNGLVERHNLTIAEMLDKILEDTNCNIEIAVAWSVNAKNSLQNVHGFSPYQLAIGANPKLPSALTDQPPALTHSSVNRMIKDNLDALHKAREAFVQAENSSRIRRALNHNIRSSSNIIYTAGDSVYYKRANDKRWRGPGNVLGRDGQQILVKHGGTYVRVHQCRLTPAKSNNKHQQLCQKTNSNPITAEEEDTDSNPTTADSTESSSSDADSSTETPVMTRQNITTQGSNPKINNIQETDTVHETHVEKNLKPTKHAAVKYKITPSDDWQQAKLISRAGKASGKYKNAWNTISNGTQKVIDFDRDTAQWEIINDIDTTPSESLLTLAENRTTENEEIQFDTIFLSNLEVETLEAKQRELDSWKKQKVYVEEDATGQNAISVRWVIKPKIVDGKHSIKARLCARGFEEEKNFRTDSPTCSKQGLRITLSTIASHKWTLQSLDIKTAFLQGKQLERSVYLKPPKEAKTDKIWRLRKCVYGLADASRYWYLRVREEICKLGGMINQYDQGIFLFHENNALIGIIACFVDDMIHGGNERFENSVIKNLKTVFEVGTENKQAFNYIGINVQQLQDKSIRIDQDDYIDSLKPIEIPNRAKLSPVTNEEQTQYRTLIGQLNWVCGISRPEINFNVCEASTKVKTAKIEDLVKINKVLRQIKLQHSYLLFPSLETDNIHLKLYSDASFNNLPNGGSQGGHLILLCDNLGRCNPLDWSSCKVKRVVRSTLAAETLALADGFSSAIFIQQLITSIYPSIKDQPIHSITDNKSLYDAVNTTRRITDKGLLIDMSYIRQRMEENEINLQWHPGKHQLSDVLTKKGASDNLLLSTLRSGSITAYSC